jgi:hypothetical protein
MRRLWFMEGALIAFIVLGLAAILSLHQHPLAREHVRSILCH